LLIINETIFYFQAEDGIRYRNVTGVQTCALPISLAEVAFTAADTFGEMIAAYRRKSKAPSGERLRKIVRALGQNPKAKKSSKRVGTTTSGAVTWNEYEHVAAQNEIGRAHV